jgi:hypothetical protein
MDLSHLMIQAPELEVAVRSEERRGAGDEGAEMTAPVSGEEMAGAEEGGEDSVAR